MKVEEALREQIKKKDEEIKKLKEENKILLKTVIKNRLKK